MTPIQELQERIRRYLLGQLSDGAGEDLERDLLTNEDTFAELLIIEEELTDEYVNGSLSRDERLNFEKHFLATPERQEDLQFARALNRYVTTRASRRGDINRPLVPGFLSGHSRSLGIAAAVAIAVIMAGAVWFFFLRQSSPPTFATLVLTTSPNTRDGGVQGPRIKPLGNETLRVYLRLPNPQPPAVGFRAQLLDSNGESRSLEIAGHDAESVIVEIPGAQLRRGQYALNLFAIRADGSEQRLNGSYYFTVE